MHESSPQHFTYTADHQIRHNLSNKCMEARAGTVVMATCTVARAQQWQILKGDPNKSQ